MAQRCNFHKDYDDWYSIDGIRGPIFQLSPNQILISLTKKMVTSWNNLGICRKGKGSESITWEAHEHLMAIYSAYGWRCCPRRKSLPPGCNPRCELPDPWPFLDRLSHIQGVFSGTSWAGTDFTESFCWNLRKSTRSRWVWSDCQHLGTHSKAMFVFDSGGNRQTSWWFCSTEVLDASILKRIDVSGISWNL